MTFRDDLKVNFSPIGSLAQETDARHEDQRPEEGEAHPVQQIESLCMECGQNVCLCQTRESHPYPFPHEVVQGTTRLLLTSIPHFREVILASFQCEHCGNANNEIQSAGDIAAQGVVFTVKVTDRQDLDRELVKSEYGTVLISDYELTIPPGKGQMTTIEGILADTVKDLEVDQPVRRHLDAATHDKIEALLNRLRTLLDESQSLTPFTMTLDDPSGNSFAQPSSLGFNDPKWRRRMYNRTKEQNIQVGLLPPEAADPPPLKVASLTDDMDSEMPAEVFSFPSTCSSCGATLETLMKHVVIPHFKDVWLMSTNCHSCGYRDTEIKSGGAIAPQGRKITLQVEDEEDLKRDVLKSDTCGMQIPEIELEIEPGTLGGRFTTLEGLLNLVYEELNERVFARGDSTIPGKKDEMETFLGRLKEAMEGKLTYTVILDDPLSNSYVQNPYAPDDDPKMTIESYRRTFDQNDELGLNDMQTEGYEGEAEAAQAAQAAVATAPPTRDSVEASTV